MALSHILKNLNDALEPLDIAVLRRSSFPEKFGTNRGNLKDRIVEVPLPIAAGISPLRQSSAIGV
jgi:hypothetical protein